MKEEIRKHGVYAFVSCDWIILCFSTLDEGIHDIFLLCTFFKNF